MYISRICYILGIYSGIQLIHTGLLDLRWEVRRQKVGICRTRKGSGIRRGLA